MYALHRNKVPDATVVYNPPTHSLSAEGAARTPAQTPALRYLPLNSREHRQLKLPTLLVDFTY